MPAHRDVNIYDSYQGIILQTVQSNIIPHTGSKITGCFYYISKHGLTGFYKIFHT